MKTFTKTTTLLITLILVSFTSVASIFEMEQESYIDDIPFNTELVASQALYEQAISVEFYLEEEGYIDDIPFDTETISKVCLSFLGMEEEFHMELEEYIDDIPFNTSKIALEYSIKVCSMVAESILSE